MNEKIVRRSRRRNAEAHATDSRDRWLISYADLATLLLALFIVLYAAADRQRATRIATAIAAEFSQGKAASAEASSGVLPAANSFVAASKAVEKALAANTALRERARVTTNERGLSISLNEAGFFAPADATMRNDALPLVDALAAALQESKASLRIEGHTDSTPISTARYPSNWELSAARAATVLARLEAAGIPSSRLSVAGFAGERPVADNSTSEGRALNRRVDIIILKTE